MPKKNTLIYIDDSLVSLAKRMKVNISETTETALREKMLPCLSTGERMILDIDGYLGELVAIKDAFILPVPIQRLELENVGPIDSLAIDFTPEVNIISGPNGSGKSVILRSIAVSFGLFCPERGNMLKMDKSNGCIKVHTDDGDICLKLDASNPNGKPNAGCLLLDGAIDRLPSDKVEPFMSKLREKYPCQLILSTVRQKLGMTGAKIFTLESKPALRRRSSKQ